MNAVAIRVEGLGKRYQIGQRLRYRSLRHTLAGALSVPFRWAPARFRRRDQPAARDSIWALKDVSFEVSPGEVVGLIGPNGAGKSTLLKILSRITEPTEGYGEIHGRVGSLLEVGTGFHPELTGRENIYLNGAILGMKRREIDRKFDEIVAFAETERFLDTPVKFYSSGMQVRLGFSVAAHLEPEILFVDEVLAVGDVAFQRKCLGKMGEVTKGGRTVVFVSHSMPSIQALCSRVLLVEAGQLVESGEPDAVIQRYLQDGQRDGGADAEADLTSYVRRTWSREPAIRRAWLEQPGGRRTSTVFMGDPLVVAMEFQSSRPVVDPNFGFAIEDEHGRRIFSLNNDIAGTRSELPRSVRAGIARLHLTSLPLLPGRYFVTLSVVENRVAWVDYVERAFSFHVEPADVYGSGKLPDKTQGIVYVHGGITVDLRDEVPAGR